MKSIKTPGVYIVEKNAFPNSVVQVATAVPAFIGYTERADNNGKSLRNKPWRITSLAEFHTYFGSAPSPQFRIEPKPAETSKEADFSLSGSGYVLTQSGSNYLLYRSLELFYQNGGGPCYIVSVGSYSDEIEKDQLVNGLDRLITEPEPTLVVVPETVLLSEQNCVGTQQAMLAHCGDKMKSRFAILDVWGGDKHRQDPSGDCIDHFRSALGINFLDYAAAYYPWLNTSIVQDHELDFDNIANKNLLQELLRVEAGIPAVIDADTPQKIIQLSQVINNITALDALTNSETSGDVTPEVDITQVQAVDNPVITEADVAARKHLLAKTLMQISPLYKTIMGAIKDRLNVMPPAAAMAGIYTMVDNSRGVWTAPANVSLSAVISPTVNISDEAQQDLNVTPQGKSVNAIRSFIGQGTLVWGARTLDGNSLDWRYVNVRRTMIMLEESIRLATKAYVFEPNNVNTWTTIKSMIRNFLSGLWKQGGLAGAVPDDAFSVQVGLGETMTSEDILEGILRVTVLVAVSHPAEFIEFTFQQQMQKS